MIFCYVWVNCDKIQPSDKDGGLCALLNPPYYVNNCDYSGVEQLFIHIFGEIVQGNSQDEFTLRCNMIYIMPYIYGLNIFFLTDSVNLIKMSFLETMMLIRMDWMMRVTFLYHHSK